MNKQQVLFSNEVLLEDARVMKLDYSLIEKSLGENYSECYYGIKITKYLDDLSETDEVSGISTSKETVVSVIQKLCQYQVTPISMIEAVDELVTLEI